MDSSVSGGLGCRLGCCTPSGELFPRVLCLQINQLPVNRIPLPPAGAILQCSLAVPLRDLPLDDSGRCSLHELVGASTLPWSQEPRNQARGERPFEPRRLVPQPRTGRADGLGQDESVCYPQCSLGRGFGRRHRSVGRDFSVDCWASRTPRISDRGLGADGFWWLWLRACSGIRLRSSIASLQSSPLLANSATASGALDDPCRHDPRTAC